MQADQTKLQFDCGRCNWYQVIKQTTTDPTYSISTVSETRKHIILVQAETLRLFNE